MTVDLKGIHHLMPEPFQVDAKNLKDQRQNTKARFCRGYSDKIAHLCASNLCKSSSPVSHECCWLISLEWGSLFWSRYRTLPPKQTGISFLPLTSLPPQWLLKENEETRCFYSPLVAGGLCSTLLHSAI